jgi:hypothetical protein
MIPSPHSRVNEDPSMVVKKAAGHRKGNTQPRSFLSGLRATTTIMAHVGSELQPFCRENSLQVGQGGRELRPRPFPGHRSHGRHACQTREGDQRCTPCGETQVSFLAGRQGS